MQDPTARDLELADRANLFGAVTPVGISLRAAAQQQMRAYERAAAPQPWLFQPFAGACIIDARTGEPYWSENGGPFVEGVYFGSIGAAARARYNAIERAQRAACRDDEYRTRQAAEASDVQTGRAS